MPQDPPASSGQALAPGTRLEEFVVGSVLGSGGFGITYLARDMSLGRKVVIKENLPAMYAFRDSGSGMIRPRSATGEDAENFAWSMRNFLREADTLASLDHPGIVKVLRQFEANGTAYFVMPFEEGSALDVQVEDRKESGIHFTEEELRGLLWYMLGALEHLHERGIYHRDIKPGNILITHEGVPVLIDFGSARQRLSEHSMTVVESAGYTPFEQLQSRGNVGPWSDIYAMGATLAKAITHETPVKTVDRVGNDPWQPLATRPGLAGRYSQGFLAGIDRALAVEPQDRWQDARQWREGVWGEAQTPPPLQVPQPVGRASRLVVPGPVSQVSQPAGPASRLVVPDPVSQVSLQMPAATRESLAGNRKVQLIAGSVLAVLLLVFMMLPKSDHDEELARIAAEEQQAEVELPARKKTPIPGEGSKDAGQPPEGEVLDDSIPFDTSRADIGTFELTEKKKQRGLEFLKSGKLSRREAAYTAFRSLGDEYKDAYAELLGQARAHHLTLLGEKAAQLSAGPQAPPDFENAHSAWKAAADAALEMIRTNWRTTAPDDYREKHKEMEGALEKARELYLALLPTLKDSGGQAMDSLQELAGIFTELAIELGWCSGEEAPKTDITKLITEARGRDGKEDAPDTLLGRRVAFAASDAVGKLNDSINRGTVGYRSFATLLNEGRVALGLKALRLEDTLTAASETHSGDMLFQNYFAHNSTDGSKPGDRAKAAGFTGRLTGACIYRTSPDVKAAYKAWWMTPGFRAAMYSSDPDVMGLGNAENYWTLNIGRQYATGSSITKP